MAPNFRYEEIIQFTPREEAEYVYRRLLMKKIDDEYALMQKQYGDELPKSFTKEMSRWKQIVNQTNPTLLFNHLPDKKLDELILEQRKSAVTRPSTKTGLQVPGKAPDDSIFSKFRRVVNSSLHHLRPIQRNQNAINQDWNDHELKAYHETLDEARTDSGSGYRNLSEGPEIDHQGRTSSPGSVADSAHEGKSDAEPYQYEQADPRSRAGEYILQNESEFQRSLGILEDPSRMSGQLRASAQADWEAAGGEGELFTDQPMTPEQKKWLKSGKNFSETTNQLIQMGNKGTLGVPYNITRDLMGKLGVSKFFQQMSQGKIPIQGITTGAAGGLVSGAKPGFADIGTASKLLKGDTAGALAETASSAVFGGAIGGAVQGLAQTGRVGLARAAGFIGGNVVGPAATGVTIADQTFRNPEVQQRYQDAEPGVDSINAALSGLLPMDNADADPTNRSSPNRSQRNTLRRLQKDEEDPLNP